MVLGLRAVGSALAHVFTHVAASLLGNLAAIVFSAPLVFVVGVLGFTTQSFSLIPLGIALLVGVLPNPCAAGLHTIAHELADDGYVTFGDYWEGLRCYAPLAARAWLLSLLVSMVILGNLAFYAHAAGSATGMLRSLALPLFLVWLLVFIIWLSIHMYVFPLLIEQKVKSIWLVYRNAALMTIARPSVIAVVTPVWLLVLVLSSATGLVTFIGLAVAASIQHNATAMLLPTFRLSEGS